MKYWELLSIFSDEKDILIAIEQKAKTLQILQPLTDRYQVIFSNAECEEYFEKSNKKFFIADGRLYPLRLDDERINVQANIFSINEIFKYYGGSIIEEALEKSSALINTKHNFDSTNI
ncbi:hypothetical protein QNI16_36255 [Cytophagaceae bacterium YF14B1]|uniref:Uncharacterized protein n=1 Tax=Xanthocytophaga flava TaxID=3048013 RepID=A0AAE3QVY6_9BACT|nr:hypothetical protein [Xanthocytophaga flavus]MDJ1485991.1 hypothetical protein [Xanthocytophaga flavus]